MYSSQQNPKHISEIISELIEDPTGKLTFEQLRDFEAFIKENTLS